MGKELITCQPNQKISVRADGPFTVWVGDNIIGPDSAQDRVFNFRGIHQTDIVVTSPDHVKVQIRSEDEKGDPVDPVPLEIQTNVRATESMEEIMARVLRREMRAMQEEEPETFEEFFYFGDEDDDEAEMFKEFGPTQYEAELEEEAELLDQLKAAGSDGSPDSGAVETAPATQPASDEQIRQSGDDGDRHADAEVSTVRDSVDT